MVTEQFNLGMPRKGDFQHFTVCGPFEPRIDDLLDLRVYYGLFPEAFFIYGTVRDAAGNMYTMARRIPYGPPVAHSEKGEERKAMGRRLMFQTNRGDEHLRFKVDILKASGTSDDPRVERVGGCIRFSSVAQARGGPWQARVSENTLAWQEDGVLSLEVEVVRPALQWYLIDRDESTLYGSMMYEARGEVLGEPVRGFIFFEQSHMAEGGVLYAHRDTLVGKGVEICWYSRGTRWDDGGVEVGHFIAGNDRAGFGMATDGRRMTLLTSNVDAVVRRAADGYWHDGVNFNASGEAREIVPDPRGRQVDLSKMPNPQQEGLVRRVGDTRKRGVVRLGRERPQPWRPPTQSLCDMKRATERRVRLSSGTRTKAKRRFRGRSQPFNEGTGKCRASAPSS